MVKSSPGEGGRKNSLWRAGGVVAPQEAEAGGGCSAVPLTPALFSNGCKPHMKHSKSHIKTINHNATHKP